MVGGPRKEDFERFKRSRHRRHAYGEYVSEIPYLNRILSESDRRELIEGLAEFIWREYDETKEFNANHRHMRKAQSILSQKRDAEEIAPQLNNKAAEKILLEAVDKGYIEKFVLNEPWHFEVFLDPDRPTTYPLQHDTTIAYTAQNKLIFFDREGKEELSSHAPEYYRNSRGVVDFKNPEGILNQGQIRIGNRHVEHKQGEGSHRQGVFFGDLSVIRANYMNDVDRIAEKTGLYSKRVVLEVQLPSNWLYINTDSESQSGNEYCEDMNSIEELDEKFGSPERLKRYAEKHRFPGIEFIIGNKTGLPLKYITGVWDPEKFREPVFVPLSNPDGLSYAKMIKKDFPHLVPGHPEAIPEDLSGIETEYCNVCGSELVWVMGEEKQVCPLCHPDYSTEDARGKQILSGDIHELEEKVQLLRKLLKVLGFMENRLGNVILTASQIESRTENNEGFRPSIRPEKKLHELNTGIKNYNVAIEKAEKTLIDASEMNLEKAQNPRISSLKQLINKKDELTAEVDKIQEETRSSIKKLSTEFGKISESRLADEELYRETKSIEKFEESVIEDLLKKLQNLPELQKEKIDQQAKTMLETSA